MRKKLVFLIIALFGITFQSIAQLTLKVPVWERFASITSEGVNLRKAPNTNSPKLYSKNDSQGHEIHIDYSWSQRSGYTPHRLDKGTVLPILEETGEWYRLFFDSFEDIYVLKKYCSLVTPISITSDDYIQCDMDEIKGGKGYLLGLYFFGSAVVDPYVRFGHKVGKSIVGADYGDDGVEFVDKYHDDELGYPNVEKVKAIDVERFLQSHKPLSTYDIWIKFPGRQSLNYYKVNIDKYKYEVKSQTY